MGSRKGRGSRWGQGRGGAVGGIKEGEEQLVGSRKGRGSRWGQGRGGAVGGIKEGEGQ